MYRKKQYAKKTAKLSKPMRKAVKQVVFRAVETKWNYASCGGITPIIFDANQPYCVNLLSAIGQGDSQQARTGDKINVSDVTFSGVIQAVPGATVHWNIYIFRSSIFRSGSNTFVNNTLNYSQFFKAVTNDSDIDIPDHEKVTIIKHQRFTMNPLNQGNGLYSIKYRLRADMKKAGYQYDSENGNLGKTSNIYGLIVSDVDQQCQVNAGMIVTRFKDA